MTHIVSNYHDDRIYENTKSANKPSMLDISSPKVMSQINTPKVLIGG